MTNENGRKREKIGTVALGVCSSIAVYKAAELASSMAKLGLSVKTVMTEHAARLISPRIFQTLTRNPVCVSMWSEIGDWKPEHISLAEESDILVVAPATANAIANFAGGCAPDFLSTLYLAFSPAKVLIAPAMNSSMWKNPSVMRNVDTLKRDGANFIGPDSGKLACGTEDIGRLAEVGDILQAALKVLEAK